ncbi:hypothetical protein RV420_290707 [Roseovarius sp. EC-SD190]|nr:hypothetical protein RV420_290707 [Roseovarius sp. EC-SD190]
MGVDSVWMNMARPFVVTKDMRPTPSGVKDWNDSKLELPCSGNGLEPFFGQIAGHNGDGNGQGASGLGQLRDQWARSLLASGSPQNQHADGGIILHLRDDLDCGIAFADYQLWINPLLVTHPFGKNFEMRLDPLTLFLTHEITHADPMVEFFGRDHSEDFHPSPGMGGAHGSKAHGIETFAAIIQHDKKLAHRFYLLRRASCRGFFAGAIAESGGAAPRPPRYLRPDETEARISRRCPRHAPRA